MSIFNSILRWEPIWRMRRNHALEHATLQVMAQRNPALRAAGYSDPVGFWLIGTVPTAEIEEGVALALTRLHGGEQALAIHPHCGTNLVTNAMLAGTFAWLGMLIAGPSWKNRLEQWPLVIIFTMLGLMIGQPLGPVLQKNVTTSPAAENLQVIRVERRTRGEVTIHRILTRF